jgi:hypothetical protein
MFAIYVSFETIILLQVLVSMLTSRYQSALGKAEYMWRYDCISIVLKIQKIQKSLGRLARKIGVGEGLIRSLSAMPYFLYKGRCPPLPDNDRYFITVKASDVQSMEHVML